MISPWGSSQAATGNFRTYSTHAYERDVIRQKLSLRSSSSIGGGGGVESDGSNGIKRNLPSTFVMRTP